MEIIFKEQNGTLNGSTRMLGIGKRQPNLIYGIKAKELREKAGLTIEELASEFKMKPFDLERLEEQKQELSNKIYEKYKNKFNVEKEYFFDLELKTLILIAEGHVVKSFSTEEECEKYYAKVMDKYYDALHNGKNYIEIDFSIN